MLAKAEEVLPFFFVDRTETTAVSEEQLLRVQSN